jgi:hypothetical protein
VDLGEFVGLVPNFGQLSHPERIKHFGWYLHKHSGQEFFDSAAVAKCYASVHMEPPPDVSRELRRLEGRSQLLSSGRGQYRLEHRVRQKLDQQYGDEQATITISLLLGSLPGKISNENEKTFLAEVLKCYRAQAFRASAVMTWNLTYDHLLGWIVADATRLNAFNGGIPAQIGNNPRRAGVVIKTRDDFEDLKEGEVLNICQRTNLITHSLKQVLEMGLTRRNLAAHPSGIAISRAQAEEMIDTLVNNVVLKLS